MLFAVFDASPALTCVAIGSAHPLITSVSPTTHCAPPSGVFWTTWFSYVAIFGWLILMLIWITRMNKGWSGCESFRPPPPSGASRKAGSGAGRHPSGQGSTGKRYKPTCLPSHIHRVESLSCNIYNSSAASRVHIFCHCQVSRAERV